MHPNLRLGIAAAILIAAAVFLQASNSEVLPPHLPLNSFPSQLNDWQGTDLAIPSEVLGVLGSGDFLLRQYQDKRSSNSMELFLAFFPSQRTGDTIHSPKNCLPGSGWYPVESNRIIISAPGHAPFLANRYLIAKGDDRQLVVYWYWAHNRAVASEYWAKFFLVKDSIQLHRSDGSLVRVNTPLASDESADVAEKRLNSLIDSVVPILNQFVPR